MRVNLKIAIVQDGRSQRRIAATCGIAENRFSEIVRGWAEPRQREREAIAAALGKQADQLFERAQVGEPSPAA